MGARTTKLNSDRSKPEDTLSQSGKRTGPAIDEVKRRLEQATGLTPREVTNILIMRQQGHSLEEISERYRVDVKVIEHSLTDPQEASEVNRPQDLAPPSQPSPSPTFLYSCIERTNKLQRVNLLTGELSSYEVPKYNFRFRCRWSELPGATLLITGGDNERDVVKIDTLREWAVSLQPAMRTARWLHAAVYHFQYVYVLGGLSDGELRECERYVCSESRWEELPPLPKAGAYMSAVELDNSLYALGGRADGYSELDTVQRLSLDSLTWNLMQLKLPQAASEIPCFKTDTQVYLVLRDTLYSFTPQEVKPIKTLPERMRVRSSFYSRGTLYYEWDKGIRSLTVGELTSP
jgi:hypothetical protein